MLVVCSLVSLKVVSILSRFMVPMGSMSSNSVFFIVWNFSSIEFFTPMVEYMIVLCRLRLDVDVVNVWEGVNAATLAPAIIIFRNDLRCIRLLRARGRFLKRRCMLFVCTKERNETKNFILRQLMWRWKNLCCELMVLVYGESALGMSV